MIVKMIVSYYIIYTNHFDWPGIIATICKTKISSIFISIYPKYYCTQQRCANLWRTLASVNLKLKK